MASKVLTTNSGSDNPNVVLADGQVLPCTLQAPVTAAAEQWGFDAFVASSTFLPLGGDPAYIPRDAASPANPMQVTFPSWTSGDTLGVWWNLTLIVNNGLTFPSLFRAYAAVSLDGGATFEVVNRSGDVWQVPNGGTTKFGDAVWLEGHGAIAIATSGSVLVRVAYFYPPGTASFELFGTANSGNGSAAAGANMSCVRIPSANVVQASPSVLQSF